MPRQPSTPFYHSSQACESETALVRHLTCRPTTYNIHQIIHILQAASKSLQSLTIRPASTYLLWSIEHRRTASKILPESLSNLELDFDNIRELTIPLEYHYENLFIYLLRHSPDLDSLSVQPLSFSSAPPRLVHFTIDSTQLRLLKFELVVEEHVPFIKTILENSPWLSEVHLDTIHSWRKQDWWRQLVKEILDSPHIKLFAPNGEHKESSGQR